MCAFKLELEMRRKCSSWRNADITKTHAVVQYLSSNNQLVLAYDVGINDMHAFRFI